jgi:hypothetical protein
MFYRVTAHHVPRYGSLYQAVRAFFDICLSRSFLESEQHPGGKVIQITETKLVICYCNYAMMDKLVPSEQ